MNVLYGLYHAEEGEILLDNVTQHFAGPGEAMKAGIGMVHQHFMLIPVFTVAENVMLGHEDTTFGGRLDLAGARATVREISARFGFDVDPDALIEDLPVGVQQRVEIIKALSRDARVLVFDEPTAVLTPQETDELMVIMRQLKESGTSIVFITHKLREVRAVADRITVESRRAGLPAEQGVRWVSEGTGEFEVAQIERADRGTSITLHLKEDAQEYLNAYKLKGVINKYSDHISLPILMEKEEWKDGELISGTDPEGGRQPGGMAKTGEWETVNQAAALWTRAKKDITQDQYDEFYKQISYDQQAPLASTHNRVEGATEYTQLLYIPSKAPMDMFNRDKAAGVKLYVKRVFIMDDAQALMPVYLRFVKGVVDSSDLPLNVSRELLQESRAVKAIREGCTKRVLGMIEDLAKNNALPAPSADGVTDVVSDEDKALVGKFDTFYAEFGAVLKEGLGEDFANRDRIAKLLRFASSTTDTATVSFADYKARMKDGQDAIYYITADTLAAAKSSPQLEIFRKKGIEVLLMADRVDEWALNYLHEFDGTPLQSVAKGAVDLGKLQDEDEKKAAELAQTEFKPTLDKLKEALKDKASDVRATSRLVDSPACLVVQDGDMSTQLARMLKQAGQAVPEVKPILEVNAEHPLVKKLVDSSNFDDLANIIFDQALLAEGGMPADPAAYVKRVNALLV